METKRWTSSFQNLPNLLQQCHIANDTSIIHVPLIVHWIQCCNLIHETIDAATKVQRPKRIALLNPSTRLDDVLVVVAAS